MRPTTSPCRRAALAVFPACVLCLILFSTAAAAPARWAAIGGTWTPITERALAGQRVTALQVDTTGRLWVGTEERGLVVWDGKAWRSFTPGDGLPDARVVALFVDRQGHLWVSTGTGLGYLPSGRASFRRVPIKGFPSLPVLSIGQAADGGILLGGPAGLAVWQLDGVLQLIPEFAGKRVSAIHTARDGVTWIGTPDGLWHSSGRGWLADEQVQGPVTALAESPEGRMLRAGDTGAWELLAGKWVLLRPDKAGRFTAAAIHDGTVWLGGLQGLVAGQEDVWQSYDARLLTGPAVTTLAWTRDDRLWVGSATGLTVYEPDEAAPSVAIRAINNLTLQDQTLALDNDQIDRIVLTGRDKSTPAGQLRFFVRLDGVDEVPRLVAPEQAADARGISIYSGRRLTAGTHILHAWTQDEAFNRSTEMRATVIVPALIHLPGGLTIRREAAYGTAGGALVLLAGAATVRIARQTRRRRLAYAAESLAVRVRTAAERSGELYTSPVLIRNDEVQTAAAALAMQNVLILGEDGMGKTMTLAQIAMALSAAHSPSELLAAAPLDLAGVAEDECFRRLIDAAAAALFPFGGGVRPRLNCDTDGAATYDERTFSADLNVLLAWLQPQRTERLVLIFLLNHAAVIDGYRGAVRDGFRRLTAATVRPASPIRLLLAAERAPDLVSPYADLFRSIALASVPEAEAQRLLAEGAHGLVSWEPDALHLATLSAGGHPARLTALGRVAALCALARGRLTVTASDVATAGQPVTDLPLGGLP